MAIQDLIGRVRAVQYTGANASEIAAFYTENASPLYTYAVVTSDANSCVVGYYQGGPMLTNSTIHTGNWHIYSDGQLFAEDLSDTDRKTKFSDLATLAGSLNAVGGVGAFGSMPSITVPGTVPGPGNANFDVPIYPRQPANTFSAAPVLTGSSSLLGSLSITGLTNGLVATGAKLSAVYNGVTLYDRVRVNVANSGLVQLAGAAILVHVSP